MADLTKLRELAAQLRELQRTSPVSAEDVPAWNVAARKFSGDLPFPLPIQVMHHLHDADIRVKDAEYRESQDELISDAISDLESGKIPESSGSTLSFHPRWLVAGVLFACAVTYLAAAR